MRDGVIDTDGGRRFPREPGRGGPGVSSATLDGTDSPRYLALARRVSGLRHQLTVPNSVVRRCQTIRQFTPVVSSTKTTTTNRSCLGSMSASHGQWVSRRRIVSTTRFVTRDGQWTRIRNQERSSGSR